jgi:hypothetical protein
MYNFPDLGFAPADVVVGDQIKILVDQVVLTEKGIPDLKGYLASENQNGSAPSD